MKHVTSRLNVWQLLFCMVCFSLTTQNYVQAQGMQFFEGNWAQLKAEAKKQHKAIFVDCYTSWCGPCKMMATKVFPEKSVGDFYNTSFVNYSLDMEKGEGPQLSKEFNVRFYPTLLYFNSEGELMHRTAGARPADMFVNEGRIALDPNQNLMGSIKRFQAGEKDTAFLMQLLLMVRNVDDKVQEDAMSAFWKAVPESELMSSYNWLRCRELDNNINSPQYNYILNHKEAFIKKFGDEEVNKALFEKAAYSIQHAAETKDEKLMLHAKAILDSSHIDEIVKFAALGEMMYYKSTGEIKKFGKLVRIYAEKYAKNNADELNNIAFESYSNVNDKELLKDALKWSEESVKITKQYANMDTYAHILYKLGKKKEAETVAKEALDLARKEGADAKNIRALLDEIQGGKK
jgi:thiol-disulfide isomerase/thioredoxin/cellobiose-specific phosphotransferase system component IIB